jgi:MFS family permease
MEQWQRNLYVIAFAQFVALGSANLVFPFIPFYIEDLGITDESAIAVWSGLMGTATGVMLFIFSPIWGAAADRFGRKPMLLRAYLGGAITMTLQGLAQTVWQLVLLRAVMGIFVGTIPAATALVAGSTPRRRVAESLGVLQMAVFISQFVGPLIGGTLAATIGIRPTFILVGIFYSSAFLLAATVVKEDFVRPTAEERGTFIGNLRDVLNQRQLALLIALIFFMNGTPIFLRPILPLLVDAFGTGSPEQVSGLAFGALALTSAIAAIGSSRISARIGMRMTLVLATFGAGLTYLPVSFANSVVSLLVLIAAAGVFSGAMVPTVNALISSWTPETRQASAFGLAGSALALAIAVAPITGGAVASGVGLHNSFLVLGGVVLVVGLVVLLFVREPAPHVEPEPAPATEPLTAEPRE